MPRRQWTDEQCREVNERLSSRTVTIAEEAERLGLSKMAIRNRLILWRVRRDCPDPGVGVSFRRYQTRWRDEQCRSAYERIASRTSTLEEEADRARVTYHAMRGRLVRWRTREGHEAPGVGLGYGGDPWPPDRVAALVAMIEAGASRNQAARALGTTKNAVTSILRRRLGGSRLTMETPPGSRTSPRSPAPPTRGRPAGSRATDAATATTTASSSQASATSDSQQLRPWVTPLHTRTTGEE